MWILVVIIIATGAERIVSTPWDTRQRRCERVAAEIMARKIDPNNTWRIECRATGATR